MTRAVLAMAALVVGTMTLPSQAQAASAVALLGNGSLQLLDTDKHAAKGKAIKVQGVEGRLVGIDIRPANGKIYGLSDRGVIYTIDLAAKAAAKVAALDKPIPAAEGVVMDFNPVADRIRLIDATGANYRIHPDTGAITVDGSLRYESKPEAKPVVVAGAYTNSVAGTKETALYTIDAASMQMNLQAPPNDGIQKPKGDLGVSVGSATGFDILADGNKAFLAVEDRLFTVDIATGKASGQGKITGLEGKIIDLAVMGAPI